MNRDDFFPSRFFKTSDVEDTPFVGQIKGVIKEDVNTDKGPAEKPVMYFANSDKGFILNLTNYDTLSEIFGSDEAGNWRGKQIELFAATTSFGNKRVPCIRVREPQVAKAPRRTTKPPAPEAEPDQLDLEKHLDDSIPY